MFLLSLNLTLALQAQQHGVELSLMPNGMSKRTLNTTRYHKNVHLYCPPPPFMSWQIDKIFWKVHVIFVLNKDFSPSSLLQYDLNGLNSNSSLLGLTSSAEMSKSLRDSSIDEETLLSDIISQFLSTTSVSLLPFSIVFPFDWCHLGSTRQSASSQISQISK